MDRLSADSYSVLDSGDLGLGRGWKPGGIYESDSDDESPCCTSDCKQDHNVNDRCSCKAGACSDEEVGHFAKLTHGRLSNALKKIRNASNSSEKVSNNQLQCELFRIIDNSYTRWPYQRILAIRVV